MTNEQAEARAIPFALLQKGAIAPDGLFNVVVDLFVAGRVPPAADLRDHFSDTLVV
jgi:hypothetical protein